MNIIADVLMLACTELPLAISPGDVSVPTLNTTEIHIEEIYRQATDELCRYTDEKQTKNQNELLKIRKKLVTMKLRIWYFVPITYKRDKDVRIIHRKSFRVSSKE